MMAAENVVTEEWIELLRAGRVLPRDAGVVTEETLHAMVAAFKDPIPVGHGYDALTERGLVPPPVVGFVHALEVRRDEYKGVYLAGLLRPVRLTIVKERGIDVSRRRVATTFSPAWIASGHAASTIVHVAMDFEAPEPAQEADTSPRGEIVAAPTISCTRNRWITLPPRPGEMRNPAADERCGAAANLVGIERWAIASSSPRPGLDGRAVAGDRYVGPQAAHYICETCRGRTIVELPDGEGGPEEATHLRGVLQTRVRSMMGLGFGLGLNGLGLGGTVAAAVAREATAREARTLGDLHLEVRPTRRGDELWGVGSTFAVGDRISFPARGDGPAVDNGIYTVTSVGTHPRRYVSASFVEDGVPIPGDTTRREKSKYGRAPRTVGQDRNSRARAKILARAGR